MSQRIYEKDLRLPALYLINLKNGKINTSELSNLLRGILNPSGENLLILANRSDDYFSQIVRNLTGSKRPFVKNGFIERGQKSGSPLFITNKGKKHLKKHLSGLRYLMTNDFEYNEVIDKLKEIEKGKKMQNFEENVIIKEGFERIMPTKVYERSNKLRNYAIEYFTKDNHIACECCSFDFEDFYGPKIGKGFIEIHHKKPVFKYQKENMKTTLENAVKNLAAVCSNCHRMIHRNRSDSLEIQELKTYISQHGVFNR